MYILTVLAVYILAGTTIADSETCMKIEVTATSYTTQDATVLNSLLFITEFTLKCENGVKGIPLHSEVNGRSLRAVRVSDENRYQVSWTDDPKSASSGDYLVVLYDDESYAAYRKALRSGEDPSVINPLVTIVVNFPGAYNGPWVNSEFMAAVLALMVSYLAYTARTKLLS